jgi:hypothetical protein
MADDPRPDKGSGGVLRSGLIPWLGFFLLVFGVAGMVIYIVGPAGSRAGKLPLRYRERSRVAPASAHDR